MNFIPFSALKIFSLSHEYGMFKIHSTSDATAAALAYQTADIHIYSNSWSPKRKFEPLDLAMREAIRYGATVVSRYIINIDG